MSINKEKSVSRIQRLFGLE